jgi:hypothetical protein
MTITTTMPISDDNERMDLGPGSGVAFGAS